jgi:hypothetical protein
MPVCEGAYDSVVPSTTTVEPGNRVWPSTTKSVVLTGATVGVTGTSPIVNGVLAIFVGTEVNWPSI